MGLRQSRFAILGLGVVLLLSACSGSTPTVAFIDPATVEEVSDGVLPQITLTETAVDRLAIATDVVQATDEGYVVPSAAVLITADGSYWVYTNPEPLVYLRIEIRPVVEADKQAFFSEGPAAGTQVVVTGVPELYGTETGLGK